MVNKNQTIFASERLIRAYMSPDSGFQKYKELKKIVHERKTTIRASNYFSCTFTKI